MLPLLLLAREVRFMAVLLLYCARNKGRVGEIGPEETPKALPKLVEGLRPRALLLRELLYR